MDIRQLHYAVVLAEYGHFGRAATAVHISQSALSQQIAKLERQLNTKLFDRSHTPISLTKAGETFLPRAITILEQVGALKKEVSSLARTLRGDLRIGIFGAGAGELTATLISGFRRTAPEVNLDFVELSMTDQISAVEQQQVDVALLHMPFHAPQVQFIHLFSQPRYATIAHTHPMAHKPAMTLADLANDHFVTHRSNVPRTWAQYWSCAADDGRYGDRFGISSVVEGLHEVAYGKRVDTAPASGARFFRHPGVRFVKLLDASPATAAVAVRRGATNPAVRCFVELAQELAPSGGGVVRDLDPDLSQNPGVAVVHVPSAG